MKKNSLSDYETGGMNEDHGIIRVTWRDAVSDEGIWNEGKGNEISALEITSVGYFWFEDKDKLVIARDYFPENNYRGIMIIPRESIIYLERVL